MNTLFTVSGKGGLSVQVTEGKEEQYTEDGGLQTTLANVHLQKL